MDHDLEWPALAVNRVRVRQPRIPHISELLSDGQWSGRPVFVIGGGPSLRKHIDAADLEAIRPHPRIGINVAWMDAPYPDVVIAKDFRVLDAAEDTHAELWRSIDQVRVTDEVHSSRRSWTRTCYYTPVDRHKWGKTLKLDGSDGAGLLNLGNSGIAAINLADVLGAAAIFLLGFDGKSDGRRINWHDRYPKDWEPTGPWDQKMRIHFAFVKPRCRAPIFNCNPESAIDSFPLVTFQEAIERATELEARIDNPCRVA